MKLGRTQEREIYARLDTASPRCDCEVHFKLNRLIAASLTCVVLEGDYRLACIKFRFLSSPQLCRKRGTLEQLARRGRNRGFARVETQAPLWAIGLKRELKEREQRRGVSPKMEAAFRRCGVLGWTKMGRRKEGGR
jgi:hypothetical protein